MSGKSSPLIVPANYFTIALKPLVMKILGGAYVIFKTLSKLRNKFGTYIVLEIFLAL